VLRHVVLAYDFSEASENALSWISDVVLAMPSTVEATQRPHLSVVHVVETQHGSREHTAAVERLVTAVQGLTVDASTHVIVGAGIAEKLVEFADNTDADAMVVCIKGGIVRRWITGSVSDSVLHHAHCPVIAYRDED
jgi:nucleotide-binding universal stress UspA family protein